MAATVSGVKQNTGRIHFTALQGSLSEEARTGCSGLEEREVRQASAAVLNTAVQVFPLLFTPA